jgi:superfamily II DNA or RNA helicase
MIILFVKSQFNLFDTTVHVAAHVRKDGVVVAPHIRIQKVAFKQHSLFDAPAAAPAPAAKRTKLDVFIDRHGGLRSLGAVIAGLNEGQQQALFTQMAVVGKKTPAEVAAMFDGVAGAKPETGETPDMFADVAPVAEVVPEPTPPAAPHELVEHVTKNGNGKTIRGVVRTDLTQAQAKEIDPYTFKKDGGWFIREKHLGGDRDKVINTGDKMADYWANSASASIDRDVKAGRTKKVTLTAAKVARTAEPVAVPTPAPTITHDTTTPFGVAAGVTKPRRRDINAGVVARLAEGGPYSADDMAQFRQYSGNGGCGDSLNEYYTDPDVARGMWTAIAALGVTSGTALEPSCATGVFLHTAPAGFKVTGVELDPVSAGVASALHGDRHEIHTACLERFATTDDRQFDVVIGNPPYGPRGKFLAYDKKQYSDAEQYFADTSMDKCKPGGIVALVVPTGIMDSKTNRSLREDMLRKGEFLGAQRMPNTAFEHSHTEVTTDVIYLRKRPDDVAGALGTVDQATLKGLGVWDDEFLSGSYFTGRGAENVLGTMTDGWRAKAGMGNDITVEGSMEGVPAAIAGFMPDSESAPATAVTMEQILDALPDDAAQDRARSAAFRRPYSNTAKVGDTKTVDGITYVLQGDPPRWHSVTEFMQTSAISDAQGLAEQIDTLMNGSGAVDRPALEAAIRAYVKTHGVPADNPDLMTAASVDRKLFRLVGAVNRKGELSDTVMGTASRKVEGGFDAVAQVLSLEHDGGTFTASELAARLDKPMDDVVEQLAADKRYAFAGGEQWSTMDTYLTGELWPKLDAARADLAAGTNPELADKIKMQADRLEKTIDAKSMDDVEVQMNSAFIPTHILAAYLNWRQFESEEHANDWTKKQPPVEITFDGGVYAVKGGNGYGDTKLLDKYLNRTGIRKEDDKPKIDAMNDEFKQWLCGSTYREATEELYNRTFRGFVAPEYSNEPIDVPGLATDRTVRDWRWSSLRRSLAMGKGIIADDVGLGKTLGGLLLARMAKVQGSAKKPIIVVPKSVLANWYEESQTWFPGCRVLTIGANFSIGKNGELVGKDDNPGERKRKYHDLTQNDYDFVLISEPSFEEVDLDPIKKEEYYGSDFWVQRGEALGNAGDKRRKAIRENYEQHLAKREFSDRTDAIWFNELGVDMLIADEMHHQKNLYAAKARFGDQPKFLGGQGLSNRALDFNLKTRWIRENNGGKNVHGLTATPTKNSPLEIYSMLSHIAPEAFEKIQIRNSEEFLDRFCEFTADKVLSTAGEIEDATVVSGFKNLDELREIMSKYIDRRTAEQVGLKLPTRDDRMHLVDMTSAQQGVYAELRELAEESSGKKDATGDSHIFAIMDKMNKAALDLELLDPARHAGASSPKYAALAKECIEGAKQGGQIVFSEYIASHDKIVAALVDAGFKREEIGVINAQVAASSVKRQNIAAGLNSGKLKVVIGNCTMAEGLNMQKTTTDIHHMDVPWEPATLQQRNGRGLRQGNMNESLRIHTYLSKGSFDGYRYQAVAAKKDWQDLLWNGGDRVDNLAREGAFTLDDMRIMLAADPEAARAKFDEDKTAAVLRHETGERTKAQSEFVRFAEMSHSYRALKNKGTASSERLRQKMEASKTSLFNNKYFPAKAALDSVSDVLIHPQTGTILTADTGMDTKSGKMVVTGVNMRAGTVTMRRHADVSGGRAVTVPVSELDGAKPFKFDAAAEASEVGAAMESAANEKVNSITKWDDIKSMPSKVLEANQEVIQRQIKDGTKSYKFTVPYGSIPMVDKATGVIKVAESYEHTKMHETHDYMLPTDANKEKAIQAWVDERRGATLTTEYVERKSGRGSRSGGSDRLAKRSYKGASYPNKNTNPMQGVLKDLSGGTNYHGIASALEKQAKAKLQTEQMQTIRRAGSANDAIHALLPLAKVTGTRSSSNTMGGYSSDGSNTAAYPKDALAMAWARARHLGQLDNPVDGGPHSEYAFAGGKGVTAHAALIRMARASGHGDLAEAFASTGEKHGVSKDDAATLRAVIGTGYQTSKRALGHIQKIVGRMGLTDKTVSEVRELNLTGPFAPATGHGYGNNWDSGVRNGKTLGTIINELLEHAK